MKSKFTIAVVTMLCSACGGGGGGGNEQQVRSLTSSNIRSYVSGDSIEATLTIHDTSTNQSATGRVTATVGDMVENPYGIECMSVIYSGTLSGTGGTVAYSERSLFYQDENNSIYECGEFNDDLGRYVFLTDTGTSPNGVFLESQSPIQLGDSTSGIVFFDDGSWEDCTKTVIAIENVSVPLGVYESYKQNQTCSFSNGVSLSGTVWTVPSIFDLKDSSTLGSLSLELSVTNYSLK